MKEFHINELRGRYHQKNFSQPSPQGTVYPWELKCEVKMSFSYDLRWPNLEDRKSVYVNEWLVWGI